MCLILCVVFVFVSCRNNVDTSDDGVVGDGTTTDMLDGDGMTTDDETTTDKDGNNTTDNEQGSKDENQTGEGNTETDNNMDNDQPGETVIITSDTGTKLNLVIEYTVKSKTGNTKEIDVVVYLESYSINVTARGNTNYVRIGDETFYFSTDAISYDGTAKKLTRFAEHTFTITTNNDTLPIYALWNFNGVYSGNPISAIIIENTINLK